MSRPLTPRAPKVIKFDAAYDLDARRNVLFETIRHRFFTAALSENGDGAVASLRKSWRLACPHCKSETTPLAFSFGSQNPDGTMRTIAGGNLIGNPAHLKNALKSNVHLGDCKGIALPHDPTEYDENKGYRIHLNLKNRVDRNPRNSRFYTRSEGGQVITLDPDLKDREPIEVSAIEKLLPVLNKENQNRVNQSVVIHGSRKFPWAEFYIPSADEEGYETHLSATISALYDRKRPNHPVFARVSLQGATRVNHENGNGKEQHYRLKQIHGVNVQGMDRPISIQFELRIQNTHLFADMNDSHRARKELFVLAEQPYFYRRDDKHDVYVMAFPVRDPDMLKVVSELNTKSFRHGKSISGSSPNAPKPH